MHIPSAAHTVRLCSGEVGGVRLEASKYDFDVCMEQEHLVAPPVAAICNRVLVSNLCPTTTCASFGANSFLALFRFAIKDFSLGLVSSGSITGHASCTYLSLSTTCAGPTEL